MSTRYAAGTDVGVSRSKIELEQLLTKRGATGFMSGWDERSTQHTMVFRLADRMVQLTVERPDPGSRELLFTPTGRLRSAASVREAAEAEERRRWRSLLLVTKARLVAIDDGVQTIEQAFMADLVLPDGSTVGELLAPQLDAVYSTATMPSLVPGPAQLALEADRG